MRRALVAFALFLSACAATFPTTRAGARSIFCEREACPAEADRRGGRVVEWSAGPDSCYCAVEVDGRQIAVEVPYADW